MQRTSFRLIAGADLYLKGAIQSALASSPDHGGFHAFAARIGQADIRFVNLEMVLTTGGYSREKSTVLYGPPELANQLKVLGVDIVSLANNHMMDRGMEGLFSTLDTLDQHGIERVGAGRNLDEAQMPRFIERNGIRVGFLGFSAALPLGAAAAPERPGVNPLHLATNYSLSIPETGTGNPPPTLPMKLVQQANEHDVRALIRSVRAAKANADYVVVSPHWGVVGQDRVMPYQEEVAHALIDAGADAILGHHPHRLHGVEVYKGRPIFYSLGHFIFHPLPPTEIAHLLGPAHAGGPAVDRRFFNFAPENALVELQFGQGGHLQARLIPTFLNRDGDPCIPEPAVTEKIFELLRTMSGPFGTEISTDGQVQLADATILGPDRSHA